MRILVSDTSVLIDLDRGNLLEATFALPFQLCVPDLLFDNELKDYDGERYLALGLSVEELSDDGMGRAIAYRNANRAVSLIDAAALEIARIKGCTLLSGDKALRTLALAEQVDCHGVLWLMERIHEQKTTTKRMLHTGLTQISGHKRCRLPKRDVEALLKLFAQQD